MCARVGWLALEDEDHLEEPDTGSPPREACSPLLRIPQRRPKDGEENAHSDGRRDRRHTAIPELHFPVSFFSRVSLLCWRVRAGVPPVPKGHDRAPSAWFGFGEFGCKPSRRE